MSFHLSRVEVELECSELKVRWQALNAAEERKEIITIVQIRECSYSILAGRKWGRLSSGDDVINIDGMSDFHRKTF